MQVSQFPFGIQVSPEIIVSPVKEYKKDRAVLHIRALPRVQMISCSLPAASHHTKPYEKNAHIFFDAVQYSNTLSMSRQNIFGRTDICRLNCSGVRHGAEIKL